jgi:hypothetical protein
MTFSHKGALARAVCILALALTAACSKPSQKDVDGQALVDASRSGDVAGVKSLLAKGTDVNWKGKFDATPLIVAAQQGNGAVSSRR